MVSDQVAQLSVHRCSRRVCWAGTGTETETRCRSGCIVCALRAACELDGCTASAFCTTRSRRALCWKLKCIRTGTGTRIRIRIHIHTHTHSQSQLQSHLAFTNLRMLPVPISLTPPPCLPPYPSPLPYISCFVESMSKVRNMQFAASTRQKEVQNERSMLFMSM